MVSPAGFEPALGNLFCTIGGPLPRLLMLAHVMRGSRTPSRGRATRFYSERLTLDLTFEIHGKALTA